MTEREAPDGVLCSRPDPANRSHKGISRSKDKYNGSNYGRRGRLDAPPIFATPSRHYPAVSRVSQGDRQSRESRRSGRGQAGDCVKPQQLWERESEGEKRGRKTSLNHLLNFTLSPREPGSSGQLAWAEPSTGRRRRRNKTRSYNKEQFLQANCQFVVADRGDYTIHISDPDLLVQWDNVELVYLFCHEIPSCPICLFPPRAAKITRCGHVYCWSCILHYLSLGDRKWRKCPICYESIYRLDLKSVSALSMAQYSPGDVISMRQMVREKGSTLVRPSSHRPHSPHALPSLSAEREQFVKLLTCSARQTLELILGPEREALQTQLSSLGPDEQSEICFIEQALEDLKARESALLKLDTADEETNKSVQSQDESSSGSPPQQWMALSEGYVEGDSAPAFSDSEGDGSSSSSHMSEENMATGASMEQIPSPPDMEQQLPLTPKDSSPLTPPKDSSLVYFYQSDDGQQMYLHTVNARCLVKEYGGLEFAPEIIEARVVELEQLTMTEEVRSRYKYLSHLPVTCQFVLCELDLRPPVVSKETLSFFRGDLEKRRTKRARKKRDEKRKEKMATLSEAPPPTDGFPLPSQPLSPEKIHDLLPQLSSSPQPTQRGQLEADTGGSDGSTAHPSFADALRGKPPPVWPIKTSPLQHTPSPIRDGSPGVCGEEDEGQKVPSFQEAFTEALLTADLSTQQGQSSKKTAKKGRKKLVLFSTGGSRGSLN